MQQLLGRVDRGEPPGFDVIHLALRAADGRVHVVRDSEAMATLRSIQSGWRPCSDWHPAPADAGEKGSLP